MIGFSAAVVLFLLSSPSSSMAQEDDPMITPPVVVFCQQEIYALCAFANCTINADLTTARCPCFGLTGVSAARIDMIPNDPLLQEQTWQVCNTNTSCQVVPDGIDDAPICAAIANGTLWEGADAVSTYSRALEVENGVQLTEDGALGDPSWTCPGVKGRLVPNCMLAPCRKKVAQNDETKKNVYYAGSADYECTCPLIPADIDYVIFGGLTNPCNDSLVPREGGFAQNTGGSLLMQYVQDPSAMDAGWDAVTKAFEASITSTEAPVTTSGAPGSDSVVSFTMVTVMMAMMMMMMMPLLS
jgi:hypothetical protein